MEYEQLITLSRILVLLCVLKTFLGFNGRTLDGLSSVQYWSSGRHEHRATLEGPGMTTITSAMSYSPTVLLVLAVVLQCLGTIADDPCNFGPTHHSHLLLPTADTLHECLAPGAKFVMSHGATFFCPHTFDVKLLGTIEEAEAQTLLCNTHFASIHSGVSSKMVLRPTLPAGGLPALAHGETSTWQSPVMYHVHNFGKDNDAGPDQGWNVTIVRNTTTTVHFKRIYGRQLDVEPRPPVLTYLAHSGGKPGKAILSHYISTSGPSGFDQIFKADVVTSSDGSAVSLSDSWPTFITIPGRQDDLAHRLSATVAKAAGLLHTYDDKGLPVELPVQVTVTLDYYFGTSDGFAGFGTMCPMKPPNPQSPSTCIA